MSYGQYQGQIYVPQLTRINKMLLILCVGLFLLEACVSLVTPFAAAPLLGLLPAKIMQGHIYQFFTFPFVQSNFTSLLFNSMVLWFIGSDLESHWGEKNYVAYLIITTVGAGLCYFAVVALFFASSPLMFVPLLGISAMTYALLFAYSFIFSQRVLSFMMLFPIKAKYFCWLLMGIELYLGIFTPSGQSAWGHLAGMFLGWGLLKWFPGGFLQGRNFLRGKSGKSWGSSMLKKRQHLHIVEDQEEEDKKRQRDPKYWQ